MKTYHSQKHEHTTHTHFNSKTIYSVQGQWKTLTKTNNSINSKNKGQVHVKEKQKYYSKNSNNQVNHMAKFTNTLKQQ